MTPEEFSAEPDDLASSFALDRDPGKLFATRTAKVDATVAAAFAASFAPHLAEAVCIAAVGGYGREELFPYSDVDLLIATANEADIPSIKDALATLFSSLWDSGLRVSHSTRTIADCCRLHPENPDFHISLLDLRYVAGNSNICRQLQARLPDTYKRHATALVSRLLDQVRQRHSKFNDTPYHLEPNVKESPGGIRDIHLLRWLAQLHPEEQFLRDALSGLEGDAFGAKEWLFTLRCFLHLRAGRDANLLTFEMQDEAARLLPDKPAPPEEWMRLYFRRARKVFQRSLLATEFAEAQVAKQTRSSLRQFLKRKRESWKEAVGTPEFAIAADRIYLRSPQELFRSSSKLVQLFCFIGEHGVRLSWDAQWAVQENLSAITATFERTAPGWNDWRKLLMQPNSALALFEMQETGVLAAAVPQWSSIDSLVVRDFYHRYTVDEHTLLAIRKIDNLAEASSGDIGRFERLAKEDGPSAELRLALLLHDIGKGTTPGDHLRGSRVAAREVMTRMDVPESNQSAVQFLIRHHLDLSILMNGRDLEDPATARLLTSEINTIENLRRLALLTFADISAVNATAMSPWRLEQLWRVYALGVQQLTRELASDRIHEAPPGFQESRSPRLLEFLDGFPKRYVRTHSREEIEHHLQLAAITRRDGVAVEIVEESGAYLLTVLAYDRSGLFAALCGALASFGMNIVKGEASSNSARYVLDLIRFTDPNRTLALNPEEVSRLGSTVKDVVAGSVDVRELLKRRRPLRRPTSESTIVPSVRFVPEASDDATLIDFVGEDRPGLLYDLATAIYAAECNIEVVMIDTEAHKALDVFYVTHHGRKLDAGRQQQLRAGLLKASGFDGESLLV